MAHSAEETDQYTLIDFLYFATSVMVFVFGTVAFVADDIVNADVKHGVGWDAEECTSIYGLFRVEACEGIDDIACTLGMGWSVACTLLMGAALSTSLVGVFVDPKRIAAVVVQALQLILMTTVFFCMIAGVVVMNDDVDGVDAYPGVSVYMCLVSVLFGAVTLVMAIIRIQFLPKLTSERNSVSVSV